MAGSNLRDKFPSPASGCNRGLIRTSAQQYIVVGLPSSQITWNLQQCTIYPMDNEEAQEYLEKLLGKHLQVHTGDNRMFLGEFKCTDNV